MHCPACGAQVQQGIAACDRCETPLPKLCPACSSPLAGGARFCSACGQSLLLGVAEPPAPPLIPAAKPFIAQALEARRTLESERRQVTVLFADLRGSFNAIEGLDAEDAQSLLDLVLSEMSDAVHRYGGVVNQVLGDGIMALFGAPVAREDHALRAACAALAMIDGTRKLRTRSQFARAPAPEIRVGLNSGEVVIRSMRNDVSFEYRAVGQTTHMAARMEQLAPPGKVLLTAETMRLGRGLLRAMSLGPTQVRGREEPVEVFELTGISTRTRFQAGAVKGLSPLVGREMSLAQLEEALRHALAGDRAAAVITGEPGIGKSRLCHELLRQSDAGGLRVLHASALSYARSAPHAVLVNLLKALFEIDDDDGLEQITDKLRLRTEELGFTDDDWRETLLGLLEASEKDAAWLRLEPQQRKRRIEQTARDLLARWCERGPSALVIEDLHWADSDSLAFITELLHVPPGPSTLLLLTHRPAPECEFPALPHIVPIALESLPRQDSESLLEALLGTHDESLLKLRQRIAERIGGNPFFIEEIARACIETGIVVGEPGSYRLRSGAADIAVPATVEALIAERIDRVAPGPRAVLQAASVIGDESPLEVLRQVADLDEQTFEGCLRALSAARLLDTSFDVRAPVFHFRHALIADVAYQQILRSRRRSLHRRVMEVFENLYRARLTEHVERLAEHSFQAQLWKQSARYHQLACVRAASRWANGQAIAHLDRGLEIIEHLSASRERDELAIDLRLTALAPLLPIGAHDRTIELLREAEALARGSTDRERQCKIYSQLASALWLTGRHEPAMEMAQRAHELAQELGQFALSTATRYSIAMIHHARGELDRTLGILRQLTLELSGPALRRRFGWAGYPSVFTRTFIISSCGLIGDFAEADRTFEEGVALADELDHPYSQTMILEEYGYSLLVRGEAERARAVLERAIRVCRDNEVSVMYAPIAARLGTALLECGEVREGRKLIEDAVVRETYRTAGHYGRDYLLIGLADALLREGEIDRALAAAREAVQVTGECGEHAYHVCALVQLGATLAGAGQTREALEVYTDAADRARALRMKPYEAFAIQGRAALLGESGSAELDAAERLWREMNAPARLQQLAQQRAGHALREAAGR